MNRPIVRIYVVMLVLFAPLVCFTSKWAVFDAEELEAKTQNRRPLIEEQQIPRGSITRADGELIAESLPEGGGKDRSTCAATRRARCSAIRSATTTSTSATPGIELSENELLSGEKNEFASIIDQLQDQRPAGADLTLTLDAGAQRLATDLLEQRSPRPPGPTAPAAVALDPRPARSR